MFTAVATLNGGAGIDKRRAGTRHGPAFPPCDSVFRALSLLIVRLWDKRVGCRPPVGGLLGGYLSRLGRVHFTGVREGAGSWGFASQWHSGHARLAPHSPFASYS